MARVQRAAPADPPDTRTASAYERSRGYEGHPYPQATGISGLVFEEAPDARPFFCDVLVKVAACGIAHTELDYPVWTCRAGHQRTLIIPGAEVSGVVAALGFGTAGIAVGEEVSGLTDQWRDGTAAEYVAVEARNVAPKPAPSTTSTPRRCHGGLTAWQALFDHGQLAKGQTAIIHGAGGAVGPDGGPAGPLGGRRGDRDRPPPFPVPGPGTGRRPLRRPGRRPPRGHSRPGRPGVRHDRRRGARPVACPAAARGNASLGSRAAARHPGRHQDGRLHPGVEPRSVAVQLARLVDEGHLRPQVGAVCIRSRKQPRRSARRPLAASPAGSSSSPDPGTARPGPYRPSRPPQHHSTTASKWPPPP